MGTDGSIRSLVAGLPGVELEPALASSRPLQDATVAIVTTAGMKPSGEVTLWAPGDASFTQIPRAARDIQVSHFSPNFDRAGVAQDLNVVFPIDRLEELAEEGLIGGVAETHVSFMGAQFDLATIVEDTAPAAAQVLLDEGTDVVIFTPV